MTVPAQNNQGREALPLVSVLFLTYKRVHLLQSAVHSFRQHTVYPNLELVIADDGSAREIQDQIRTIPVDTYALAPRNRGLGANFNQGLQSCHGKYVLVIQDDWTCHGPEQYLAEAVRVLEANPNIGLINFAGEAHPPDYSSRLNGSTEPCYVTPQPLQGAIEYFLYSDQPHLQSRAALDFIGPYLESKDMEECEIDYNHRWKNQTQFLTAVFPGYYGRTFRDEGGEHSFRTTRFRYRVHAFLQPAKPLLLQRVPWLFQAGKSTVQAFLRIMERLRLVR
jgi:glycosyltransferase involved in cell wall biosynthesis